MAKADSNYEKTGRNSRLTLPLKRIRKSHLTPRSTVQYHTALRFEKIRISQQKRNRKQNYFNPWSVVQRHPGREHDASLQKSSLNK